MASYPHTLVISRPGAGSMGSDDVFAAGSPSVVYSGPADVQDEPQEVRREGEGTPKEEMRAVAFLEDESLLDAVHVNDVAQVTFGDASVRYGTVVGSRKLDGTVVLKWTS